MRICEVGYDVEFVRCPGSLIKRASGEGNLVSVGSKGGGNVSPEQERQGRWKSRT